MNPNVEAEVTKAQLINLNGANQLFKNYDLEKADENGKVIAVLESIERTIDAKAMLTAIPIKRGYNAQEESAYLAKYPRYVSPLLEKEDQAKVINDAARFAVAQSRLYLDMTPEQRKALSDADRKYYAKLTGITRELLVAIQNDAIYNPQSGTSFRDRANMFSDVTTEERRRGDPDPVQPNLKASLRVAVSRHVDGVQEIDALYKEIATITDLDPIKMSALIENKALDPKTYAIITDFMGEWYNREEYMNATIDIRVNTIKAIHAVGADVDLMFRLKGMPVGEDLKNAFEYWVDSNTSSFGQLMPYYTGLTVEQVKAQGLTMMDIFQRARKWAGHTLTGAELEDYRDRLETLPEYESKMDRIISIIRKHVPLINLLMTDDPDAIFTRASKYSQGRAGATWFSTTREDNQHEVINSTQQNAFSRSERNSAITASHEVFGHTLHRKITNTEPFPNTINEFFAQLAEAAIPKVDDQPELERYDHTIMGSSYLQMLAMPRMAALGMANYEISKFIEERINEEANGNLVNIYQEARQKASEAIPYAFGKAFERIGMHIDPWRGVQTELSVIGFTDGFDYLGPLKKSEATKQQELLQSQILDNARRVMVEKFKEENWMLNQDARAVYMALMIHAIKEDNRDMKEWPDLLRTIEPKDAYILLAEAGISEDNI